MQFKLPPGLSSNENVSILIVEDEPLVAADLEAMITEIVTAIVTIEASVAATKKMLHESVDFAFLDMMWRTARRVRSPTFSNSSACLSLLFRVRRKSSSHLICALRLSFPSPFTRLKLSACCEPL